MLGWVCENRRSKNTKNELLVFPDNIIWEGQEWWELSWTGQVSMDSEIRNKDNQSVVAERNMLQNRM